MIWDECDRCGSHALCESVVDHEPLCTQCSDFEASVILDLETLFDTILRGDDVALAFYIVNWHWDKEVPVEELRWTFHVMKAQRVPVSS